jgi:glycosyltransferase involved in cell wall biosynthesis
MKLLIYSNRFAPDVGGTEAIVMSLAGDLSGLRDADGRKQFDVTVATQTPPGNFDDSALAFRVVRRPGLAGLWRLIRWCNVVSLAGPALAPLFLARLVRKPLALEHHTYQAVCPNGLLVYQPDGSMCPGHFQAHRYWKCFRCQNCEKGFLRGGKELLAMVPRYWLSRSVAKNIAVSHRAGEVVALPRSMVIYHGVADPLGNYGVAQAPRNSSWRICFAYVGRFVPEKGIPTLLHAAGLLRREGHEFDVRLVGDGPERAKLEAIIRQEQLANCVRFTGFLTGKALADMLSDVNIVVVPSVWEETAGLAAIEQMMRGRLVIASDVGGLGEIVGDAGLKFTPGDAHALADCMRIVLQERSVIDSYGRRAHERALQLFVRDRMVQEHAVVYRELARGARG